MAAHPTPSAFMRKLRPELYSDSSHRDAYRVDDKLLGYALEHITPQNRSHEFEIFCRKLAEQAICAHIKPSTGPDGGGDAKVDADTLPVLEQISQLYVGHAPPGDEKWAFAFSAKEDWVAKVKADVASIQSTGRGYKRIYFMTSREAKAKPRAALEKSLKEQYGVPVEILDRTWIINEIIDKGRQKLALDYLKVGEAIPERRVGKQDFSRAQDLEDIEAAILDPTQFEGVKWQLVAEALRAAKLSRELERPRTETDGQFVRAIRLADQYGTSKQRIEARYESIWTAVWWFDDLRPLLEQYEPFEKMLDDDSYEDSLELLCTLLQLLFNAVLMKHERPEDVELDAKVQRLDKKLERCIANIARPNTALGATVGKIRLDLNRLMLAGDRSALPDIWKRFEDVIERADGLGEFSAQSLKRIIEAVADLAGEDPSYTALIAKLADFVERRAGAAAGALVKLNRARQLSLDSPYELIRLLGEAAHRFTQKEYGDELVEAATLLGLAYHRAGLRWAARASAMLALATASIQFEQDTVINPAMLQGLVLLSWCSIDLLHLPDLICAVRLARPTLTSLKLEPLPAKEVEERLYELDIWLGGQILQLTEGDLSRLPTSRSALQSAQLALSQTSLIYALGYEAILREEGWIPKEVTAQDVKDQFKRMASASDPPTERLVLNVGDREVFGTQVLGMRVTVSHPTNDSAVLIAEAIVGGLEAVFATTPELALHAHTERFSIVVKNLAVNAKPSFEIDETRLEATVRWPEDRLPASVEHQIETREKLATLILMILRRTCVMTDEAQLLKQLIKGDTMLERLTLILAAGNSRNRLFNAPVGRLSDDQSGGSGETHFPIKPDRPLTPRTVHKGSAADAEQKAAIDTHKSPRPTGHRDVKLRSLIDKALWDEARWRGIGYAIYRPSDPPVVMLLFEEAGPAAAIFQQWIDRLGTDDVKDELLISFVRGIPQLPPFHYRAVIASTMPDLDEIDDSVAIISRQTTMEPATDENLARFLEHFQQAGSYLLVPAVLKTGSQPVMLPKLRLRKRVLKVVWAKDVKHTDVEWVALNVSPP